MKITQTTQAGNASKIMPNDSKRVARARTSEQRERVRPYA